MSDDRTRALYRVWKDSRTITIDTDGVALIKYYDGAVIEADIFTVHVGNQQETTDDLDHAEKWLWNNWVRHEKKAEEV